MEIVYHLHMYRVTLNLITGDVENLHLFFNVTQPFMKTLTKLFLKDLVWATFENSIVSQGQGQVNIQRYMA